MAIIDNTLASKVDTFNPATPLMQAATIQNAQAEAQANQFKAQQQELGAEMRGLKPYMNTPEFASKWAETADRLLQRGVVDPQTHEKWRNSPSPLLMQSVIAKTSDPTMDFRKEEAARDQANQNRTFANQDRQFNFVAEQAKEKPSIQKLKGPDGEERLVQVTPQGVVRKLETGETAAENPFAPGGKLTEAQAKDGLYASRIFQSEKVLRDVENSGSDPWERAKSKVPLVGNYLVSGEYQKFDQAQRDFINATLRRESGAVIADSEFANANKQYFPQPGDSQETKDQKRRNRAEAAKGIAAGAGSNFVPPYIFGPKNELIPNESRKAKAAKAAEPKAVKDKAEFDALPSGSQFVAPDGSVRIKP
jgi:hypothetical protein